MSVEDDQNSESPAEQEQALDADADSSTAVDDGSGSSPETPPSLLDAVEAVLEDSRGGDAVETEVTAADEAQQEAETSPDATDAGDPETGSEEQLPFHEHPRWQAVMAERDAAKAAADKWDNLTTFMSQHGLDAQDASQALELASLVKQARAGTLPAQEALAKIEAAVGPVYQLAGKQLPDAIQQRVDSGELDDDTAQELSVAQAQAANAVQIREEQAVQQQQLREQAIHDANVSALSSWEQQQRQSDPDFDMKSEALSTFMRARIADKGYPPSINDALAIANESLTQVNALFSSMKPADSPKATGPKPPHKPAAPALSPVPKTILEAAEQALSLTRSA